MQELILEAVEQRIAYMEQANHLWKVLGITAVALLGLIVLLGATRCIVMQNPSKARNRVPGNLPLDGMRWEPAYRGVGFTGLHPPGHCCTYG